MMVLNLQCGQKGMNIHYIYKQNYSFPITFFFINTHPVFKDYLSPRKRHLFGFLFLTLSQWLPDVLEAILQGRGGCGLQGGRAHISPQIYIEIK